MIKNNKRIEPFRLSARQMKKKRLNPAFASTAADGNNGAFLVRHEGVQLLVLASDGSGWDHASVSVYRKDRDPSWREMCFIKDLFWAPNETVIQYHPPEAIYISMHDHCLHLWRPAGIDLPLPDPHMVGLKKGVTH